MAHAIAMKVLKDEAVFSQRRAILRKRLILLKKHSPAWRSLQGVQPMALAPLRVGFCAI